MTGIVRRIDELGRIVIPKEMRKTLRLHEGDEVEISASDDKITLCKYEVFENLDSLCNGAVNMIADYISGAEAYLVDQDKVLAYSSANKVKYIGCAVSDKLRKIVLSRSSLMLKFDDERLFDGQKFSGYVVAEPILVNGDLVGTIVVLVKQPLDENKLSYVRFASAMVSAVLAN